MTPSDRSVTRSLMWTLRAVSLLLSLGEPSQHLYSSHWYARNGYYDGPLCEGLCLHFHPRLVQQNRHIDPMLVYRYMRIQINGSAAV